MVARLAVLACIMASSSAFAPSVSNLALRSASSCRLHSCAPSRAVRLGRLRMQQQDGQDPYAQDGYAEQQAADEQYYTEAPVQEMSAREKQMARVMERQAIQDAEKARRGPLALESNRIAVILGVLFIGLPVVALLGGFLSGAIPNPLDVCIEGGTNC